MALDTPLLPGEILLKDGAANMRRGSEAVGGHLYLTNARLIFESHALNFSTGARAIPRASLVGVEPRGNKLFRLIPINNSIAVRLAGGGEEVFVVNGRAAWIAAIGGRG